MRFYKFSTVTPDQDFINTIGQYRTCRRAWPEGTTRLLAVLGSSAEFGGLAPPIWTYNMTRRKG